MVPPRKCHPRTGTNSGLQNLSSRRDFKRKKLLNYQELPRGAPTEIRTPVLALKGLRPSPLDDGGSSGILPSSSQRVKDEANAQYFEEVLYHISIFEYLQKERTPI